MDRERCMSYKWWTHESTDNPSPCKTCIKDCEDYHPAVSSDGVNPVQSTRRSKSLTDTLMPWFRPGGRLDWDNYFMNIAVMVSLRSTCLRRKYGAVIVNPKTNKIISTGFNGAASGHAHCLDTVCERQRLQIPHGQQYEKCVAVHAEQNALISGDSAAMNGAVIYISGFDCETKSFITAVPCEICLPMLQNAHIRAYLTTNADDWIIETKI